MVFSGILKIIMNTNTRISVHYSVLSTTLTLVLVFLNILTFFQLMKNRIHFFETFQKLKAVSYPVVEACIVNDEYT